jgi:phosphopantothenoylcysteine decarboxylase/phosphopantothenate--cysteine ligase
MEAAMLYEKNVVLGVSGSIAAYKAVYLARLLIEARARVYPMLTRSATRFIGPLTLSSLTGHRAVTDMWSQAEAGEIGHVEWAHLADVLVLAPATADLLARLAVGRADSPLTAVALATRVPWVVAPAMESGMWQNDATQQNIQILRDRGARVVDPQEGTLASGRVGVGRMAEPEDIFEEALAAVAPLDLVGQRVLVTAGPTREGFDPVRFISNASTGKMGYALAREARCRGAEVCLVSGPTQLRPPHGVRLVRVTTTQEMLDACRANAASASIIIMAAAPADHRPASYSAVKTKKAPGEARFQIELENTPDILVELKARKPGCIVVGFAAETGAVGEKARGKLAAKDLDMIVANDVTRPDAGFAVDTNVVEIIMRDGSQTSLPTMTKDAVAAEILDRVAQLVDARR